MLFDVRQKYKMNQEPETEYQVALNVMGLSPRNHTFWRDRVNEIQADLANHQNIQADVWVGAFVGHSPDATCQFYLFALDLDLDTEEGLELYRDATSKVEQSLQKHMR